MVNVHDTFTTYAVSVVTQQSDFLVSYAHNRVAVESDNLKIIIVKLLVSYWRLYYFSLLSL